MVLKQLIVVILISGCLAFDNDKKFDGGSKEFYEKSRVKKFKNFDGDAARQLEKDYDRWSNEKHGKHSSEDSKEPSGFMKINEIEDGEYIDKYSKFKTHPKQMRKIESLKLQNARNSDWDKSLLNDICVNYINKNNVVSKDSELIENDRIVETGTKEEFEENYQNENDMKMKRIKKNFYDTFKKIDLTNPPTNDTVLMARYIVHSIDWAALGTLSSRAPTKGAPFVCVKATSDGVEGASSGIPFFYMSPMDLCTQDLQKDNRVSVLVTLSETEYCKNKNLDPQDPRCAKLTLSGKIKKLKPGSDEEKFAKNALFTKHPAMATWPASHNWYFSKLKIGQIVLLDRFGGATYIKVKDYLNGGAVEPTFERK